MIVSLLYLNESRLNIMFSVCMYSCFHANPKESHLTMVKFIMRYLTRTPLMVLWFLKGINYALVGYSNSQWYMSFSREMLVSKHSKKQTSVLLSIVEVEYVDACSCCS